MTGIIESPRPSWSGATTIPELPAGTTAVSHTATAFADVAALDGSVAGLDGVADEHEQVAARERVTVEQLESLGLGLPRDVWGHPVPELSVVVPMYRETERIAASIEKLAASPLNRPETAFVFVDDGSRDATTTVAFRAIETFGLCNATVLRLPANVGKGGAVKAGVAASRGRFVAFLDADLSLDPAEVSRAFARMQLSGADVVVGERVVDEAHQPRFRRIASRCFRVLATSIVSTGVNDPQCAMKIFRGSVAKELFRLLETDGYAFDVEVLARARRSGLRIDEQPVGWRHQDGSKVRPVADGLQMMRELARIRGALRSSR